MNAAVKRVLVFGATGPTGGEIVCQGLERGLDITAFVRDPAKLNVVSPGLQTRTGDVLDPASVDAAFAEGFDAVACALGMFHKQPETWLSDGTANIVAAMKKQGVNRIVVVSSLGAGDSRGQGNLLAKGLQKLLLRHVLDDKTRQEAVLRESGLDWTAFRPPQLTLDPVPRDDIVLWTGKPPKRKLTWKISRASVAKYVLDSLMTGAHSRSAVNMSEPA
jgi:putative NADH-flavin reductase